jgi:Leucine rich repeat variant
MWPVLIFLFAVICLTLYHWNHEYNRRKNHTKMAKNDCYMQSDTTENITFPKAAIFDTPPNPEEVEIASNPSTDPEILAKLGKTHQRRSIRRYVASNPNTPVSILCKLARVFPQEVADNPMVLLLQLENPEFVLEIPDQDLVAILRCEDTPEIFINGAIGHHMSIVITALLRNPKLSSIQLERLIDRVSKNEMIHVLVHHRHCSDSLKMIIAKGNNQPLQIGLARNCLHSGKPTAASLILLEALIDHGSLEVQKFIACDTYTSDALLDRLLADDRQELAYEIADNTPSRGLSDRLQLRLAQNQLNDLAYRISVRQTLAENKVNPGILALLSRDPYAKVRASVAKRSDLPQDMLLQLAQDPAAAVQHSLIRNKSIDADRLTAMAQTSHPRMRELAAQHPNTPISILETLVDDPRLAEHIARNPNTPAATLQKIAAAGTEDIALTQNTTIPDSIVQPILAKLAIDPNYTRRKLVARHPQTPRLILTQLAQDPEPKVQHLAQQRLVK